MKFLFWGMYLFFTINVYCKTAKVNHQTLQDKLILVKNDLNFISKNPSLPYIYVNKRLIALMELVKEFIDEHQRSEKFNKLCNYLSKNYNVVPYYLISEVVEEEIKKIDSVYRDYKNRNEDQITVERILALLKDLKQFLKDLKLGQKLFLDNRTKLKNSSSPYLIDNILILS